MRCSNNATMLFVVAVYWWFQDREDLAQDAIDVALRWVYQQSDVGDAQ